MASHEPGSRCPSPTGASASRNGAGSCGWSPFLVLRIRGAPASVPASLTTWSRLSHPCSLRRSRCLAARGPVVLTADIAQCAVADRCPAEQGVRFDLPPRPQRFLGLRADSQPGADLLAGLRRTCARCSTRRAICGHSAPTGALHRSRAPAGDDGTPAATGRGSVLRGSGAGGQWLPVSSPVSLPWRSALRSFSPVISTVLPRWAYLVSIASRAATEEASQTWASDRSMTILSGSPA